MSVEIGLFADCHFHPVCGGIVVPGQHVCDTCRTAWGQLLRPARPVAPPAPSSEQTAALTLSERRHQQEAGATPRANQRCWLCETRKSCLKTAQGWECAECRQIT